MLGSVVLGSLGMFVCYSVFWETEFLVNSTIAMQQVPGEYYPLSLWYKLFLEVFRNACLDEPYCIMPVKGFTNSLENELGWSRILLDNRFRHKIVLPLEDKTNINCINHTDILQGQHSSWLRLVQVHMAICLRDNTENDSRPDLSPRLYWSHTSLV